MFNNPTFGVVSLDKLKKMVREFMYKDKNAKYEIIVGSDSQKLRTNVYDFVFALIVHKQGGGAIYFWKREVIDRKLSLKERIYMEATMSLQNSENFVSFFKENGISKYDIQIHVDIGHHGKTRELIQEVTSMIRGSGYDLRIKPDSFGASKVADRHT